MEFQLRLKDKEFTGVLVEYQHEWSEVMYYLSTLSDVVYDTETDGLYAYLGSRITGVALYFPEVEKVYYISFRHPETANRDLADLRLLHDMLFQTGTRVITWNGKFDLLMANADMTAPIYTCPFIFEDTMLALHLLDENRARRGLNYKLKDVATQFIAADAKDEQAEMQDELKKRGLAKGEIGKLPAVLVAPYAMMDVILTWELRQFFMPYLDKWMVQELYREQNEFVRSAIVRMELNGFPVDRDEIARRVISNQTEQDNLLRQLQASAGYPINPNSPQQIAAWLRTDDARRSTLELLDEPNAKLVVDYKFVSKANGTFYIPYLEWSAGDGRLHPSLNVMGTVTGRLSSNNPNLQQVPRKSVRYNVKECLVAPEGYTLVQADYKQLELRLACYFAREQKMTRMFLDGTDMHQFTADMLGITRQAGKTANFGLLYGMGPKKAMSMFNVDEQEAKHIVYGWHELYPEFKSAAASVMTTAMLRRNPDMTPNEDSGYQFIRLMDGRVRHYTRYETKDGIVEPDYFSSWNTLVQGTGAIIARRGIQRLCNLWPNDIFQPCLAVHDSVVAFVRTDRLGDILPVVRQELTNFPEFTPPMGVDIEIGSSWGKLDKWNGS